MMKSNRIFKTTGENEEELLYEFRRPTQDILSRGELVYRVRFSEALREGILLNAEVSKVLKKRGLWGDEQEQEALVMRTELRALEEKLSDPSLSNEEGMKVVEEVRAKRAEHSEFTSMFTTVADNTCESLAQEERNQFFTSECVYNKTTGQRVYKGLEDFKAKLGLKSTQDSYHEATLASLEVLLNQELPSDLSTRYAENKWIAQRGLDSPEEEVEEAEEKSAEVTEEKPVKAKAKKAKA